MREGCLDRIASYRGGYQEPSREGDDALDDDEEVEEEEEESALEENKDKDSDLDIDTADSEEEGEEEGEVEERAASRVLSRLRGSSSSWTKQAATLWRATPPISQAYVFASALITLWAWIFNENTWPSALLLDWFSTIFRLQVWRPLTTLLHLGPFGLNYVLTLHFVWTYMSDLEKINAKAPEEFVLTLLIGCVSLFVAYAVTGLPNQMLGHNLASYMVYIWSRIYEGMSINMMDMFMVKAELMPWFFCLMSVVMEGGLPIADLLGIASGLLHQYLRRQRGLAAPASARKLFPAHFMSEYKRIAAEAAAEL